MTQRKTSSVQGTGAAKLGKKVTKKRAAKKVMNGQGTAPTTKELLAAVQAHEARMSDNMDHVKKDIDGIKDDLKKLDNRLWALVVLVLIAPHLSKLWGA